MASERACLGAWQEPLGACHVVGIRTGGERFLETQYGLADVLPNLAHGHSQIDWPIAGDGFLDALDIAFQPRNRSASILTSPAVSITSRSLACRRFRSSRSFFNDS